MKRKKYVIFLGIGISILFGIFITGCTAEKENNLSEVKKNNPREESIKITSLGNILFHEKQLEGARTSKGYDFNPSFTEIKDNLKDSDLKIGIVESTLSGNGKYTGYPTFNSPDEILPALNNLGLDVINYASNHILDSGANGVTRTVKVTKDNGIDVVGVRDNINEKRYLIKEVKGQKIGIISYVFETAKIKGRRSINSIELPTSIDGLINTFNYGELDVFYKDIDSNIKEMKSEGVKFIITSLHWGEEYDSKENSKQREMSNKLSELGVNIILGGHPHVVQPYDIITNSKGEKTFVAYSQGNFLSNQCYEEIKDNRTEDGLLINFILGIKDDNLYLKEYELIPTWVYREEKSKDLYTHKVLPLDEDVQTFSNSGISSDKKKRLEDSLERTKNLLKDKKIGTFEF